MIVVSPVDTIFYIKEVEQKIQKNKQYRLADQVMLACVMLPSAAAPCVANTIGMCWHGVAMSQPKQGHLIRNI